MIDLHMHTDMSDGSDSPIELLNKIAAMGCKVFSVTDHDDLRANSIILSALNRRAYSIKFITGCEISSVYNGRNLHLLCYGFNPQDDHIKILIAHGAELRRQKVEAIFDHLKSKHNIIIPDEYKADILSRQIPGKVHIADAAIKMGIKMKRQEFFDTCLDDMESREFKVDAGRVIDFVTRAGGYVSFAHPVEVQREYGIDINEIAKMSQELSEIGLGAIEVYHSLHGEKQINAYKAIASNLGLYVSGGSDYHGKNKEVNIGQLSNCEFVPDDAEITLMKVLEESIF